MTIINPYDLLGVTINSSVSDLKKSYYSLALLCHPDKGGDASDMNTLVLSYKYLLEQLEYRSNKTYEEVEAEFEAFCKEQEQITPPDFATIYGDAIDGFNREFESTHTIVDPFGINNGYGKLMDKSEATAVNDATAANDAVIMKEPLHQFTRAIQIYEEPISYPGYLDNKYPLNITEIKDYSGKQMTDYYQAFCNHEIIPETEINNKTTIDVMEAYEKILEKYNN